MPTAVVPVTCFLLSLAWSFVLSVGTMTGDLGLMGLEAFGKPLLYTIFVVAPAGAFRGAGVTDLAEPRKLTTEDDPDAAPGSVEREGGAYRD